MSWRHIKTHTLYSELVDHPSEFRKQRGYTYARSATTGRLVTVRLDRLVEVVSELDRQEGQRDWDDQQEYARRERLSELAWLLSRELTYNLGTAVTNIAMAENGGSLLTAVGALRDEMHRQEQAATAAQPPVEGEA